MVFPMLQTPWGDADSLRDRPAASSGRDRDAARREQRERLFAAMVASCERKGYEATSVADLLEISGVSRGTFYAQFDDKLDCFCAAEKQLLEGGFHAATGRRYEGDREAQARKGFEALVDLIVTQPAPARMVFVHSYVAGERALEPLLVGTRRAIHTVHQMLEQMPGKAGAPMELARAIVGGFYLIVYRRLERHREAELCDLAPAMWEWVMSYAPPPRPLKPSGRRPTPAPAGPLPPFAAYSPEQRIIRAFAAVVAEKGYPATTIADVCAAAGISQTTFYLHFADKRDMVAAALDSGGAQLLAATMPAARRAADWPRAVRAAAQAICAFFASEPAIARLGMVHLYSAGPELIAGRDQTGIDLLRGLLAPAFDGGEVPGLFVEATVGGIIGILYDRVLRGGPSDVLEAAPLITYIVLSPLLGAEEACAIATEKRPRPATAGGG
jgi:AcrR family transcriptional regulator